MTSTAQGINGIISLEGIYLKITRIAGVRTFLNQGIQGDRHILVRAVTAIEFRDALPKGGDGFISFDFPGKNPPRGGVFDAIADENAVVFNYAQRDEFFRLSQSILSAIAHQTAPDSHPVLPVSTRLPEPHQRQDVASSTAAPNLSIIPHWLRYQWREGRSGWSQLVDTANGNGWRASMGVGVMQFEHREKGTTIRASSIDAALAGFASFYAREGTTGSTDQ